MIARGTRAINRLRDAGYHRDMRLAVIGLGFMGSVHLRALRDLPEADVSIVARSTNLSSTSGNLPGPVEPVDFTNLRRYPDIPSALADPTIEAIDICLPTDLHSGFVTLDALAHGKHVLVENRWPFAPSACTRMVDAAHRANRILMVAHVLRFFPTPIAP